MERLLRGLIQVGNHPEASECVNNWTILNGYDIEFESLEDLKIKAYLDQFIRDLQNPPDYSLVREHFEKDDDIQTVDRLDEIKRAPAANIIRTNYNAICIAVRQTQRDKALSKVLREGVSICLSGMKVGKQTLKGFEAATEYVTDHLRQVEGRYAETAFTFLDSVISQPVSPAKYIVPHFRLADGRPNGLAGYAGSAKTFCAIELAIACAAGRREVWGGLAVGTHGPVVHLDYEMGERATRRRYQRVAHGMGVTQAELDDRLFIAPFPATYLTSKGAEGQIMRLCEKKALLVVDSFKAATPDEKCDENASSVRKYLDMLSRVSDATGIVVLCLHHERKTKEGEGDNVLQMMRGSSGLADAFGATVHIKGRKDGIFELIQGKASSGRPGQSISLRLEDEGVWVPDHDDYEGISIRLCQQTGNPSGVTQTDSILEVLRGGGITNRDVLRARLQAVGIRIDNNSLSIAMKELFDRGLVQKANGVYVVIQQPSINDVLS